MVFSHFRRQVLVRLVALVAVCFLCLFVWRLEGQILAKILLTAVPLMICWRLLNYVDRTNRELERFLMAINYDDFSQSFTLPHLGGSYAPLGEAFEQVMSRFRKTRQAREEASQFSTMVIQQVPVAVVVVNREEELLMANNKARQLLGADTVRQPRPLAQLSAELAEFVHRAQSGDRKLVDVNVGRSRQPLMVSVAHFVTADGTQKIVCLQNIRSELDRQEVQAWQDLIRVLSHEILNSITPITSLSHSASDILNQVKLNDVKDAEPKYYEALGDVAAALDTIARRSDGLLGFVERYRQVARLPQPEFKELDIGALLEELAQLMRRELSAHHIVLEVELETGLPEVRADQQLINQALLNLLRNAQQAVAEVDNAYIRIAAHSGFTGTLMIAVHDNGCGIAQQELEKSGFPFTPPAPTAAVLASAWYARSPTPMGVLYPYTQSRVRVLW